MVNLKKKLFQSQLVKEWVSGNIQPSQPQTIEPIVPSTPPMLAHEAHYFPDSLWSSSQSEHQHKMHA